MPRIIISDNAKNNIIRLREFLKGKNPNAAMRAAQAILKIVPILEQHPQIGRPIEGMEEKIREVSIPFGRSGYVVRYLYAGSYVKIIAVRHMKEVGFQIED